MAERLYVGTRKGLFEVGRRGGGWAIVDVHFLGDPVSAVLAHAETVYAALERTDAVKNVAMIGAPFDFAALGFYHELMQYADKPLVWTAEAFGYFPAFLSQTLFNLTQPEATGLVHYGPEDIQVIEMVRLEAPEGAGVAAEGELPPPPAQ